ncbi:MAG: ATP-NAD kinase family protein [Methanomassiliicoccales archaeon]|nr:ATP-NAD kinase family protein [Methanomassiliicoccales archaeon]
MLVGLVVNPLAGMGGSVGLKGTDGREIFEEAKRRGARPVAEGRMRDVLSHIPRTGGLRFLTASGAMGEGLLATFSFPYDVVHRSEADPSSQDTRSACAQFLSMGARLIIFGGGDGTARDVMDAVGERVPVIGVPSGVKMHSAVFANTPQDAASLIVKYLSPGLPLRKSEVMDIDEEAFREGRLSARLYGYVMTPYERGLVQPIKGDYEGGSVEEEKESIAAYVAEEMKGGVLYILGPGTTLEAVAKRLGVPKTLLGVDAVLDGKVVAADASERDLLALLDAHDKAKIFVTPIGAQGFILGRGNQQISAQVVREAGLENLVVLAAPTKLKETRVLRVDTGDDELDRRLRGFRNVVVGFRLGTMVRVE